MKMSTLIYKIGIGIIAVLCLTACSSDDSDMDGSVVQKQFSYTMHLDDNGVFSTITTRGTASWTDNSIIYLRFLTEDNEITGKAVYSSETDTWTVTTDAELILSEEENSLTAYYFEGSQSINEEEPDVVQLTPQTGIYTSEGNYTHPSETDIYVKTKLQPLYWRMCFRGEEGQTVTLEADKNDIYYAMRYYLEYGDIEPDICDLTLTVGNSGYTPYFYGWLANMDENVLCVTTDAEYIRIINYEDLNSGNSFYCQLPTAENYEAEGWQLAE